MRFNTEAYDKVFPRQEERETIESAVDTFTPTADEQGDDNNGDGTTDINDNE